MDSMNLRMVNDMSSYSVDTNSGGRKAITTLLRSRMVAVNGIVVNKERISAILKDQEVTVKVPFVHEGTVLVNGNGSASDGSYPITAHKTVCFDMKRANGVTGINPDWGTDEFFPVGFSLANLPSGQGIIPIQMVRGLSADTNNGTASGSGASGCCDTPFELGGCLDSEGCADAFTLEMISGELIKISDTPDIQVCDTLYKGLEGCDGDRGFAQNIGGILVIKTLTCSSG